MVLGLKGVTGGIHLSPYSKRLHAQKTLLCYSVVAVGTNESICVLLLGNEFLRLINRQVLFLSIQNFLVGRLPRCSSRTIQALRRKRGYTRQLVKHNW